MNSSFGSGDWRRRRREYHVPPLCGGGRSSASAWLDGAQSRTQKLRLQRRSRVFGGKRPAPRHVLAGDPPSHGGERFRVSGLSCAKRIGASREFERLRLSLRFSCRYRLVVLGLYSGSLLLPQISGLSQIVSELAVRMESAMQEMGERAAVAAELASSLDRRWLDLA